MTLRRLALVPLLTLALGLSLALAYFLVGGTLAWVGPYVLSRSWPVIYPLMALLAATVGFAAYRWTGREFSPRTIALLFLLAWLGEYLVLASRVLADELGPVTAAGFWLMATCGPLQPAAAMTGAWLARRSLRSKPKASSP